MLRLDDEYANQVEQRDSVIDKFTLIDVMFVARKRDRLNIQMCMDHTDSNSCSANSVNVASVGRKSVTFLRSSSSMSFF